MTTSVTVLCRAAALALIGVLFAAAARPQTPCAGPTPSDPASRRPRIGLALGGGGARGAAHIGVLKVLEELRIPIDCIAGTSMGSVVGGLYVVGYSPETLGKVIGTVDWTDLFIDRAPRSDTAFRQKQNDYFVPPGLKLGVKKGPSFALPTAFIAGRKLGFLLNTLTLPAGGIENFDELAIPFRAVGADARTGEAVALSTGSLPRAIRASMAIPLIFTPVEVEGRLLIDGGNAQNLPVETARAMGAEVVIAVDVGSSGEIPEEAPTSMGAMLGRLIDLPLLSNTLQSRKLADLLIIPNLRGFGTADFGKMGEIIPRGETAARADAEKLSRYSVSEDEYRAWQKAHRIPLPEEPPKIDEVVVDPIPGFDVRRISRLIAMKPGFPLNDRLLRDDMRRIAGMGHWQNIEFRLEQNDGRNILHIVATPKSWGPTFLEAGLDFEIDDAAAGFDLSLLIDATELNRLGADWKTALRIGTDIVAASRFFQPVDYTGRFFVSPRASWSQTPRDIFFEEERVAEYRVRQAAAGLDVGMVLGHLLSFGQVSIGVERGRGNAERRIGVPQFPDFDFDTAGYVANVRIDQLDNLWFPRSGYFADVEFFASRTDLGADFSFNRGQFLSFGAHSVGRWTGTARVSYGDSFNSELPVFALFSLGGFRNLSGRPRDQLLGSTLGFGSLEVRYRLTATGGAVVKGVYLGASAETGNVWSAPSEASLDDLRTAGSVYAVTDTLLGPLYIAYGHSGKKNRAFYLFLNRSF